MVLTDVIQAGIMVAGAILTILLDTLKMGGVVVSIITGAVIGLAPRQKHAFPRILLPLLLAVPWLGTMGFFIFSCVQARL